MSNNNSHVNILIGQVSSNNPKLGWIIDSSVNIFSLPLNSCPALGTVELRCHWIILGTVLRASNQHQFLGKTCLSLCHLLSHSCSIRGTNPPGLLHIFWVLFMLTAAPFYSYVTQEDERLGEVASPTSAQNFPSEWQCGVTAMWQVLTTPLQGCRSSVLHHPSVLAAWTNCWEYFVKVFWWLWTRGENNCWEWQFENREPPAV